MTDTPIDRRKNDPYLTGHAPTWWDHPHTPPETRFTVVGSGHAAGEWKTTPFKTRAVRRGEVIAVVVTGDESAQAGAVVKDPVALGFIEMQSGGMMVEKDGVLINGEMAGELAAFDETEQPNHLTVVIKAPTATWGAPRAGTERGLKPGDSLTFEARFTPFD